MCTSEAYMLRHFVELSSAGKPAGGRGMVVPPPRRPLPHCDATAKYINTASAIIICHGSQKCYVCMMEGSTAYESLMDPLSMYFFCNRMSCYRTNETSWIVLWGHSAVHRIVRAIRGASGGRIGSLFQIRFQMGRGTVFVGE